MQETWALVAKSENGQLTKELVTLRALRGSDVCIDVLYCGICHTDIHILENQWKDSLYPMVPGHEIIGRVTQVGSQVSQHKVGDIVGVGCMIESCRNCPSCLKGLEQYCYKGFTFVFNSLDKETKQIHFGGFSKQMVLDEHFAIAIPKEFKEEDLPFLAPIFCAGITTYSPLKHWKITQGSKIAIHGFGGLGHMALKLGTALGAEVTVLTSDAQKIVKAKQMGARAAELFPEETTLKNLSGYFDFVLDTSAGKHDLEPLLQILGIDGTVCLLGLPSDTSYLLDPFSLVSGRKKVAGSVIGSIAETKQLLSFCAEKKILPEVKLISPQEISQAFSTIISGKACYRYVLDMQLL